MNWTCAAAPVNRHAFDNADVELISISNVSFSISFQTVLPRLQNIVYNNLAITSRADRLVEIFGRKEYRLWK